MAFHILIKASWQSTRSFGLDTERRLGADLLWHRLGKDGSRDSKQLVDYLTQHNSTHASSEEMLFCCRPIFIGPLVILLTRRNITQALFDAGFL